MNLTLHHYWRSSCSWRVRLSLEYKELTWQSAPVDLLLGEQSSEAHLKLNPSGTVPVLQVQTEANVQGFLIQDSTAILEWLEENYPEKPLLPSDSIKRAKVRYLCQTIGSGIQPIQNLKVLKFIEQKGLPKKDWGAHWITAGFKGLETSLSDCSGKYCFGDELTLADTYLVPQCYNAKRFGVDLSKFPQISKINETILSQDFSKRAHADSFSPENATN